MLAFSARSFLHWFMQPICEILFIYLFVCFFILLYCESLNLATKKTWYCALLVPSIFYTPIKINIFLFILLCICRFISRVIHSSKWWVSVRINSMKHCRTTKTTEVLESLNSILFVSISIMLWEACSLE